MKSNNIAESVASLDLQSIKQKLMHAASGEGWSQTRADAVETEYRRFLTLMKIFPKEATAPLVDVDTFWHYHILDTMKYAADCAHAFGYFLHHNPYLGFGDDSATAREDAGNRMQTLYEATFGEPYGAALQGSAWCGVAGDTQHAAWCGVARYASGKPLAWCGVATAAGQQSAWCGIANAAARDTAWCGVATAAAGQTAWCGVATAAAGQTAWCGVATAAAKQTAWCGVTTAAAKQTAWCGVATAAAEQTAWCGVATAGAKQAAWCGVAKVIDTAPGVAITVREPSTMAA